FSDRTSPPPFNWTLTSSTVGLAERQPGGRLHVLFYGQEDGFLASELLLLTPGAYRLSMQLLGDPSRAHNLNWSIWCDKAGEPIASITLDAAAALGWRFEVPKACPAQWLKLSGVSGEVRSAARSLIAPLYLFGCLILGGSAQGIWQNMVLQLAGVSIVAWALAGR